MSFKPDEVTRNIHNGDGATLDEVREFLEWAEINDIPGNAYLRGNVVLEFKSNGVRFKTLIASKNSVRPLPPKNEGLKSV